jgi:DNA-directed RNA polymerase specialized sigma24 family protein
VDLLPSALDAAPSLDTNELPKPRDRTAIKSPITEGEEITSEIQRALSQLPPTQRKVVVMRTVYGLTLNEISIRLRITEAAVKNHLAAGMAALIPMLDSAPGIGNQDKVVVLHPHVSTTPR